MRILVFNLATDADDPLLNFAVGWLDALARRVTSVHVITMRQGRASVPANVHLCSVGKERGYSEIRRLVRFYQNLLSILRTTQIDVCFAHMMPLFTVLAAPILQALRIPTVLWYAHRQVTPMLRLAHSLATCVVSVNSESYPYRQDKLIPVGHGIDINLFAPGLKPPAPAPLLLSVARIAPIKDPLTLVEAVSLLRQAGYRVQCVLVGPILPQHHTYAAHIQQQIVQRGLQDDISLLGPMASGDVVQYYQRCWLHITTAPADHSVDKAGLEALACGRPTLASAKSFRETLGVWAEQLLFRQGDAADLSRKIAFLLDLTPGERTAIGLSLRQRVIELHSLERLADRLIAVFEQVIG